MPVEPIGLSEIADLLGVTTRTVQRYLARAELKFPEPKWTVAGRRAWDRQDVERWARKTLPLAEGHQAHRRNR